VYLNNATTFDAGKNVSVSKFILCAALHNFQYKTLEPLRHHIQWHELILAKLALAHSCDGIIYGITRRFFRARIKQPGTDSIEKGK
jgi:hypothetical protein